MTLGSLNMDLLGDNIVDFGSSLFIATLTSILKSILTVFCNANVIIVLGWSVSPVI